MGSILSPHQSYCAHCIAVAIPNGVLTPEKGLIPVVRSRSGEEPQESSEGARKTVGNSNSDRNRNEDSLNRRSRSHGVQSALPLCFTNLESSCMCNANFARTFKIASRETIRINIL
eukprot:COSAG02_NODE_2851_length_7896_cov_28.878928_7_plen_116_part_00